MLIARNSKMKMVKILDSVEGEKYKCPICNEILERNFGLYRQYYSHPKDKGNNCELKVKLMLKNNPLEFEQDDLDILKNEYYNKQFDGVNIEMSDYMSEEGYYLTQEQKDIIFAPEDRIKVSALAGAAKTSTLYYFSKERPFKKILYIVYNKAMKDEAEKSFGKLRNVEIKTIHGLAYSYVGKYYKHKLTFNYKPYDIIKDLKLDWNEDQELAVKTNEMFKEYLLSDATTFDELEIYNDKEHKEIKPRLISLCKRLWELKKDYDSKVKVEHDFYLKMFQLAKKDISNKYDIILLDECQDGSKLLMDILKNSNVKSQVLVGDIFQILYSWRKSENLFPLFKGKEYFLTTSFRVGQQIANIANMIISDVSDNTINMKGFNIKQKIVEELNRSKPYIVLCRTNSSIFSEVIDAIEHGKKALYFEGGYSGYKFENILDCYYFSCGHKTKNPILNKFKDYFQMKNYAEKTDDIELLSLIRMVDKYESRIPNLINSIKDNTIKEKSKADVLFSTIHKSKGQTYSIQVLISDDHFDIENLFNKKFIEKDEEYFKEKDFYEEMCILYVAITRAAREIIMSDTLKQYLITRYKYFKNTQIK